MADTVKIRLHVGNFAFASVFLLCVLCHSGATSIATTVSTSYPSDVSSVDKTIVSSSIIQPEVSSSTSYATSPIPKSTASSELIPTSDVIDTSVYSVTPLTPSIIVIDETTGYILSTSTLSVVLTSPSSDVIETSASLNASSITTVNGLNVSPTTTSSINAESVSLISSSTESNTIIDSSVENILSTSTSVNTQISSLTSSSTEIETTVTLITSFTIDNSVISSTLENLISNTLINGTSVISHLFSTSSFQNSVTAVVGLSITPTSNYQSNSANQISSLIISTTELTSSDMSSAISPSTAQPTIQSSLYTDTSTVTDLLHSSSSSFGDTSSVIVTSMSSSAMMTEILLQPSTVVTSLSSVVTEVYSTLTNSATEETLSSSATSSTLSASPQLSPSSDGLYITSTTHVNTPVYTSIQNAASITTDLLKTSSEIIQPDHVTSSDLPASSTEVLIAPTSSIDAGFTSTIMPVTPDPALLAELDNLRNKVQELEDSNSGLQTATIVLAIIVALIILLVVGVICLRRRRKASRKKSRFAGIDADLTTPVIQRPKPAFDYRDSKDMGFGGRVSTATLEENNDGGEMSTLGTFSTLPKSGIHNNNMDTPS